MRTFVRAGRPCGKWVNANTTSVSHMLTIKFILCGKPHKCNTMRGKLKQYLETRPCIEWMNGMHQMHWMYGSNESEKCSVDWHTLCGDTKGRHITILPHVAMCLRKRHIRNRPPRSACASHAENGTQCGYVAHMARTHADRTNCVKGWGGLIDVW